MESLTATSSGAAVVLGVDDAHLLDELSIFVLHQIVLRGAAKMVITVLGRVTRFPLRCKRYGRLVNSTG